MVRATGVGEVGQRLTVGRPRRKVLGRADRLGHVARVTLLGGNGDDLTARVERRANAGRRQRGMRQSIIDGHPMRKRARQLTGNAHVDRFRLGSGYVI